MRNGKPNEMTTKLQQTSASNTHTIVSRLTLVFLVALAAASVYNARHDPVNFSFVVFVYVTHGALLACKWWWDKREEAGKEVAGIKAAVWGLGTALSVGVVWWMATLLPKGEAVWALLIVLAVVFGGLYGVLLYGLPAEFVDEKRKVCAQQVVV